MKPDARDEDDDNVDLEDEVTTRGLEKKSPDDDARPEADPSSSGATPIAPTERDGDQPAD